MIENAKYSNRKLINGYLGKRSGEKRAGGIIKGHGKLLGVMDMFITLK